MCWLIVFTHSIGEVVYGSWNWSMMCQKLCFSHSWVHRLKLFWWRLGRLTLIICKAFGQPTESNEFSHLTIYPHNGSGCYLARLILDQGVARTLTAPMPHTELSVKLVCELLPVFIIKKNWIFNQTFVCSSSWANTAYKQHLTSGTELSIPALFGATQNTIVHNWRANCCAHCATN